MASCGPLHTCELCGQDGLSETEMRSHMQIVHVEGSPACPFCDLADLSHSEMEVHVNCAHLDFLTPESDDMQYLEGGQEYGSLWQLDRCAGEEGLSGGGMGESPGDDFSKKPRRELWDAGGAPNPFIDSEEEDDTTVCSVVEKSKLALENSPLGSPRKRLRSCGSADSCSPLPRGSPKLSSKDNSSLNGLASSVQRSTSSQNSSPNQRKCDYSSGKGSPRPGSSSPRPGPGPGSPSRRDLLRLPLRRPTGGCSLLRTKAEEAEEKGETLTCPMCNYTNSDSDRLQEHVNRVHLDHLSPAAQSVSSCPMCSATFTNPTLLQTHFNSAHPDTFTPSPSSPVEACPVCGDTGWSVDQLQLHVESHFAGPSVSSSKEELESERLAQEMERKAKRKREEEAEFASLQAQYGMDEQGNFRSQSASGLRKAVVSGKLSVVDYYERSAGLAESQRSGVDDGSSVTPKITLILRGLSHSSHGVAETLLASRTDHYSSTFGDKGWGCGFRNLQMILSALLHSTLYREVVLAAAVGNRNLGGVRSEGVPSIPRLQQVVEEAWRAGFDRAGCEQLGGRLVNSRKWIGATEVATFLAFCHLDTEILDFHAPTAPNGTHPRLFDWVVAYFRKARPVTAPLYLQHQGHSRTVVGAEVMVGGAVRLLVLDPSHSPTSLGENTMRLVRKTLVGMKSKQYQVVAVIGKLNSAEERDAKKIIVSRRIPEKA